MELLILEIAFWVCIGGLCLAGLSIACLILIGGIELTERTPEEKRREAETILFTTIVQ